MAKDITIGEMKAYDIDNLEHVLKTVEEHTFTKHDEAVGFFHQCLFKALGRLGVKIKGDTDPRFVDKMLKDHHVKAESRKYEEETDMWREGLYIYKTDEEDVEREIVGFISPIESNHSEVLITPDRWTVRTNIKI